MCFKTRLLYGLCYVLSCDKVNTPVPVIGIESHSICQNHLLHWCPTTIQYYLMHMPKTRNLAWCACACPVRPVIYDTGRPKSYVTISNEFHKLFENWQWTSVYIGGRWIKKLQILTYPLYFVYFWHSYLHYTKSWFICIYRQQHGCWKLMLNLYFILLLCHMSKKRLGVLLAWCWHLSSDFCASLESCLDDIDDIVLSQPLYSLWLQNSHCILISLHHL